ncbi:MAG: nucleotide pyrophosphohydrolase [Burkholderiales bacterium]
MCKDELAKLAESLQQFAAERDWDQFHSPKNLACALSVETSEVLEHFQWLKDGETLSEEKKAQIALELADVLLYLTRLADKLGIDLISSAQQKLVLNAEKYPVDIVKGSSKKYTEY